MVQNKKKNIFWNEKLPFLKNSKKFFEGIDYHGINLWPIMAGEIYMFQNAPIKNRFEKFLKEVKFLFSMDKFHLQGKKGGILVSYPIQREDHHYLVLKAIEKFPKKDIILLDNFEWKKKKSFLKYKFRLPDLKLLFNIWNKFKKEDMKKVFGDDYLYFLTRAYFRHKQIEVLKKIYENYSPRAHIAFCSQSFAEDSILTLLAKKDGKPTFTLEHGFLPDSSVYVSALVMIENIISDYVLVWGERNYNMKKKYISEDKLILVGNPKYSLVKKKDMEFKPRNATFFFSVTGLEGSNENALKILNKFAKKHPEINFNLKLHPFDSKERYLSLIDSENLYFVEKHQSVVNLLEKSDFVVIHNTSVVYEALLYRIPIFRFKDEFTPKLWNDFDIFNDYKSFENLFDRLKKRKMLERNLKEYEKILNYSFYFDGKKDVSQKYYEEISKKISSRK